MNKVYEDERGTIEDLVVAEHFSLTRIFTRYGAVRGNHVHDFTTQWTYVTHGKLEVASPAGTRYLQTSELHVDLPGVPHAWKAMTDTTCLVLTEGPRAADFESDTRRLEEPLL